MIYVTKANFSLLTYHLKEMYKQIPSIKRISNEIELYSVLQQGGSLNETLTEMVPALFAIEYEGKVPKNLEQVDYNVTYIRIEDFNSDWKYLVTNDIVKYTEIEPSLYKGIVEPFRTLFTQEGFEYFWEELCLRRFKANPYKWNAELTSLLIRKKRHTDRFSQENLELFYSVISPDLFNSYLFKIGTKEGSKLLYEMSDAQLWTTFMGGPNRPPVLRKYLVDQKRSETLYCAVSQLQLAVDNALIDLRPAVIILNEWLGKCNVKSRFKEISLSVTIEQFRELRSLLHLESLC